MPTRAIIIIALLLLPGEAYACLSLKGAREKWPGVYLSWRKVKGKQCWISRVEIVNPKQKNRLDYAADKKGMKP